MISKNIYKIICTYMLVLYLKNKSENKITLLFNHFFSYSTLLTKENNEQKNIQETLHLYELF